MFINVVKRKAFILLHENLFMAERDEKQRILDDIRLFDENVVKVNPVDELTEKVVDLAARYRKDAEYFLEKQDFVTAFGCINYAHGLLDAFLKFKEE